ncbi:alpha/beta hydrolase [Paenibacillus glucanolyticus]
MSCARIITFQSFYSTVMNNVRDIHIYLPPSYDRDTQTRYPVLYVHDGQNVFHSGFNGQSWRLDHVCNRLISEGRMEEIIIVAIGNAGLLRNEEYAHGGPFAERLPYPCRGEAYERFLIRELKPFVDRSFRTKRESRDTGLMGSSRGGLVTYHLGFNRPDVFGKVAMLSPYFYQYHESSLSHEPIFNQYEEKGPLKLWIDTGGMEGMTVQADHVREMAARLLRLGYRYGEELAFGYFPEAVHNEEAWADRVHGPLLFLFGHLGEPDGVELTGSRVAGMEGKPTYVHPLLRYAGGLTIVDGEAELVMDPEDSAHIDEHGLIVPRSTGDCCVRYERGRLGSALHPLTVLPHLREKANVAIRVRVPTDTPEDARIHAGIPLVKKGVGIYEAEAELPLNAGFSFHITEESGLMEADHEGKVSVQRHFVVNGDLKLQYEVIQWTRGQAF